METISNDSASAWCRVHRIVTAPAQQHATKPSVYNVLQCTWPCWNIGYQMSSPRQGTQKPSSKSWRISIPFTFRNHSTLKINWLLQLQMNFGDVYSLYNSFFMPIFKTKEIFLWFQKSLNYSGEGTLKFVKFSNILVKIHWCNPY